MTYISPVFTDHSVTKLNPMNKIYLLIICVLISFLSQAQITSVTSGNWNDPSIWSSNTVPICTDTVVINAGHVVSVNTPANNAQIVTVQYAGNLVINSGSLTIGCTLNNNLLTNDGLLSITGGTLNVNGGIILSPTSSYDMSGGILNIDPNDGTLAGSYDNTNGIFYINSFALNVTGGTINILDPPYIPGQRIIGYDTNTEDAAFGIGNTLTLGGGTNTNPANTNGFYIECNATGGTLEIGTLVVNGGRFNARRHLSTNPMAGFITKARNLTVNAGSEAVISGSLLAITGNIVNNGLISSASSASAALAMVGDAFYSGGIATSPSTTAQAISGTGYFKNTVTDPDPTAQTGNIIYSFTNYHSGASPGLTLGMPLTVYGILTLVDGKVNTTAGNFLALGTGVNLPGNSTVYVPTGGTLQNSRVTPPVTSTAYPQGGWVTGIFKRYFLPVITTNGNNGLMPVGSDTSRIAQVQFTTAPSAGGYLIAQWFDANGGTNGLPLIEPAVTPSTIDRVVPGYWSVVNEGGNITGGTYTATFTNTRALGIQNYTKTTLLKRANAGSPWLLQGTHVTTTGSNTRPTVKRTGLAGFSEFAIGANVTVLPVAVEFFRGSRISGTHYLEWKVTCTSEPFVRLILERSSDGKNFRSVNDQTASAVRCGQGFNYTDALPLSGKNYYRLKTITPDGELRYSAIVVLLNKEKGFELISVAPNPVKTTAILSIITAKTDKISFSVFNAAGKQEMKHSMILIPGTNSVNIDFSILGAGTHIIRVINEENEVKTTKFVKY